MLSNVELVLALITEKKLDGQPNTETRLPFLSKTGNFTQSERLETIRIKASRTYRSNLVLEEITQKISFLWVKDGQSFPFKRMWVLSVIDGPHLPSFFHSLLLYELISQKIIETCKAGWQTGPQLHFPTHQTTIKGPVTVRYLPASAKSNNQWSWCLHSMPNYITLENPLNFHHSLSSKICPIFHKTIKHERPK